MKNYLRLAIMATGVAASIASVQANIIVNGSFETHDAFNGSGWNYFNGSAGNTVLGWTSGTTGVPLEVGLATVYGVTGQHGVAVMELDTTHNVSAQQAVTTSGSVYELSFLNALRSGVLSSSGTLKVYWNASLVATLSPGSTVMTSYTTYVTGTGSDTLAFLGTGTDDTYGALIDNVSLTAVPEPSTYVAGGLLLIPLIARGIRSRRNRN